MVWPGGNLIGASVIRCRLASDDSASNRRMASATRSRSDDPRLTAAILARFIKSSGRSKVVLINMLICFYASPFKIATSRTAQLKPNDATAEIPIIFGRPK